MKKISVKNDVASLTAALCGHTDCPQWLADAIWDAYNSRSMSIPWNSPIYWQSQLEAMDSETEQDQERERREHYGLDAMDEPQGLFVIEGGLQ